MKLGEITAFYAVEFDHIFTTKLNKYARKIEKINKGK